LGAEDADALKTDRGPIETGAGVVMSPSILPGFDPAATDQRRMVAQLDFPGYPGGSLTGLFNNGSFLGRFAAGFLGSGLLGLLFGRGLFGGLGGFASYLGLLCQIALILLLCRLIWTRWRGGKLPEPTAMSLRQLADPYLRSRDDLHPGGDSYAADDHAADHEVSSETASTAAPRNTSA